MERGEEHFRDRLLVERIDEDAVGLRQRWIIEHAQEALGERGLAGAAETDERTDAAARFAPPRRDTIELSPLLIGARGLQPMDEVDVGHEAPRNEETRRAIAPTTNGRWIFVFMSNALNEGWTFNPRIRM